MKSHFLRPVWNAILLVIAAATLAHGQNAVTTPNLVTAAINEQQRATMHGSVAPQVKAAIDLGVLPSNQALNRMVLVLKPSDAQQTKLRALIEAQQMKGSPQYHKWLTPAQFSAQFSPSAADIAKVAGWLQSRGFTGVTPSVSGQRIEFSGTTATVESAFQTSMHKYQVKTTTGLETHVANAKELSIPSALAPVVSGVLSLNDFRSKPMHVDFGKAAKNADGKLVRVKGDTSITDGNGNFEYFLSPGDIRKIYGATALPASVDGTGVSVAILGRSNVQLTDLQVFRKLFQIPAKDPNIILSGPDPGVTSYGDAGESTLDLEWMGALAPNADINFITAASTDTTDGISLAAVYAVENVSAPIISLSYGQCEQHLGPAGNLFWNLVWEQAAAEGISVFVSSGDGGAAMCDSDEQNSGPAVLGDSVSGLSSTPYNVSVGGTQFAENGQFMNYWDSNNQTDFASALGYIPEAAWNESCDPTLPVAGYNCAYGQTYYMSAGGGGGRSSCSQGTVDGSGNVTCTAGYKKPAWQTGAGVPADGVRDVPDVSLNASSVDDPYILCFLGGCQYTVSDSGAIELDQVGLAGGTSISTPVMAGIMALIEQQNGQWQGLPNPILYQLASQQDASCSSTSRTDPTAPATCIFNDVTAGNNGVPGLPGYGTDTADFTAGAGYDLATGLGSVNIANLVNGWKNASAGSTTTTALTLGSATAKHGSPIDVKVAVSAASGTPTGDVVLLTDKYGAGDQYTLASDGTWSGAVKDLPGGTYTLTARYGGDDTYANSTSTGAALTITPEASVSSLALEQYDFTSNSLIPITASPYLGFDLYFKGHIAGVSGQGTPTGSVNVLVDGKTSLASTTLTADGGFLLDSESIPVGKHSVTVQYSGDNSFNASTSAATPISVGKGQTVTFPSSIGGPNNLMAVIVTSSGANVVNPTGTVQVFDNGVAISSQLTIVYTGPLGDGAPQVLFSHKQFADGVHVITATYSGDSNYLGVALGSDNAYPITLHIGGSTGTAPTITTAKMTSAATLQMGQIATFNYAVAPKTANAQVPTGTVFLFNSDGNLFTGGTLTNGQGSSIFYADSAGTFTLTAQYQGDSTYAPSLAAKTLTFTVPKLTPVTTFTTSAAYAAPGTQTTLNFTAAGVKVNPYIEQDPIGSVTFTDSVNGGATVTLGTFPINFINGMVGGYSGRFTLPAGTNVVTANYPGNANFNPVTATAQVVVSSPDFVFTSSQTALTVPDGSSASATLTLTPELGYTGPVSLTCSGVPAGSTCTLTPASLTLATEQTVTATIATPAASPSATASNNTPNTHHIVMAGTGLTGAVLAGLLVFVPRFRRRSAAWLILLAVVLPMGIGCGGGSSTPKATLLAISSSSIKSASGSQVTLTATLSALTSSPTGTVTFFDGTTALGSPVSVSEGAATLQTSALAVGAHTITAVYSGDKHNGKSTSIAITQVITGSVTVSVTATSGALVHVLNIPVAIQ